MRPFIGLLILWIGLLCLNSLTEAQRWRDDCFQATCNRWVAPSGSQPPSNDTFKCGNKPSNPCLGLTNATFSPHRNEAPLVICLLPGSYFPRQGPFLVPPGAKICGASSAEQTIINGEFKVFWEYTVFLLRDKDFPQNAGVMNRDAKVGGVVPETHNGFARFTLTGFLMRSSFARTPMIDLIHVAGPGRYLEVEDVVITSNEDVDDYLVDCRASATCSFSNVNMTYNPGGALFINQNATAIVIHSHIEHNLGRVQGAVRFDTVNSVRVIGSTFVDNPLTAAYIERGNTVSFETTDFIGNSAYDRGGAIRASNANLRIVDCNFMSNKAIKSTGGAISATWMNSISILHSNFQFNQADAGCGAVELEYMVRWQSSVLAGGVDQSNFDHNTAHGGHGGAICTTGVRVNNTVFDSNRAALSGGAVKATNVTVIANSKFTNNIARDLGGGIYIDLFLVRSGATRVVNCLFEDNAAGDAGGGFFAEDRAELWDCTFFENNATYGGAIGTDGDAPNLRIFNNTYVDNSAVIYGGAMYLAGLLTHVTVERSSFRGNWGDRNGGAIHLFAPFAPRHALRVSDSAFVGNWLLHDGGGSDITLNSSVAIFKNVTILSVLISDWEESRDARAVANFTNSLFLDDPRLNIFMQGAGSVVTMNNCSFLNHSDCPLNLPPVASGESKHRRRALKALSEDENPDITYGCAVVQVPYTISPVSVCPVGRYFRNETQNCQMCQQGQYNFNGKGGKCFDCPNRIACVQLRGNIQYEVLKGYEPQPFENPLRVIRCKMHMLGMEALHPQPHIDDDPDKPTPVAEAPVADHHVKRMRSFDTVYNNSAYLADFGSELTSFGQLRRTPLLRSSTRHVVVRNVATTTSFRYGVKSIDAPEGDPIDHGGDHHDDSHDNGHHDEEDHSPCLPTFCHSVCNPSFGNVSFANCSVLCTARSCADGYEGRLCSKCECLSRDHCWYRSHHSCHRCRSPERLWPSIALLVVSLVVFTVFRRRLLKILFFIVTITAITLVLTRAGDRFLISWILIAFIVFLEKVKTSSEGVLKSFIFWIQTTLTLINSYVWPAPVRGALEYLQLIEFNGWGLECYFPSVFSSALGKFMFILLLPVLLSLLLLLSVSGTTLLRKIEACKKLQEFDPLSFNETCKRRPKKKKARRRNSAEINGSESEADDPYAPLLQAPPLRPKPKFDDDHEGEWDNGPLLPAPKQHHHHDAGKHAPTSFDFLDFHVNQGQDISAKRESVNYSGMQSMKDLSSAAASSSSSYSSSSSSSSFSSNAPRGSDWEKNSTSDPHQPKKRPFMQMIVHGALFFLFVTHFEIATSVFEILTPCEHAEGEGYYMVLYPYIKCEYPISLSTEYGQLMFIALTFGLIYIFGMVILFAAVMYINRQKIIDGNTRILNIFGFLYESYRTRYYWFEVVWLVRRVLLAAAIGMLIEERILYPVAVSSILMISLLIQRHFKPFTSKLENYMEQLTICVLIFTLIAADVLENSRDTVTGSLEEDHTVKVYRTIVQWSIFGVNLTALLCFLVAFFWRYIPCLKPIEYVEKLEHSHDHGHGRDHDHANGESSHNHDHL